MREEHKKPGPGSRALIVTRLSRANEQSTSKTTQLELCEKLCKERGYQVVGHAEDLGVSAAISPFKRKKLRPWLKRPHDYDVIVFARVDRIVRRLADISELIAWAENHSVTLVSVTEEFFDLSAPFGDIIALLVAKVAEMELSSIRERTGRASKYTIEAGRWRGGVPPWGYRPQKNDDGHWSLVQDPDQVAVIKEVVGRVVDEGESLRSIAHDLTRRGVMTPKDAFAKRQGREVKGYQWHSGPLRRSLTSPTMLGQMTRREPELDGNGQPVRRKGKPVLGKETVVRQADGTPLVRAEPILDKADFDKVGNALAARENRKEPDKRESGLLRQILHCGVCGRRAYRLKGGEGRAPRYRCASAQYKDPCDNRTITMDEAEKAVEEKILDRLGDMERTRRVWHPGSDVSAEMTEVDELLADLVDQLGTGMFKKGTPGRDRLDERIAALAERREELAAQPTDPAGWRYIGTGESVGEWWSRVDPAEKTAWMQTNGVRATWRSYTEGGVLQTTGKFAGRVVGGKTVVESVEVDMGTPDLNSETLPDEFAELARLKAAGAWSQDPALVGLPDVMARIWWREGGPRMPTVEK